MKVIILAGIPGSGKSTYIKKNYPNAQVVSTDDFFTQDGHYVFNPALLSDAHALCIRSFLDRVQVLKPKNDDILIVDNTNTTIAEIAPYYAIAEAYGHDVRIVVMGGNPKVAASRNAHNVPYDTAMASWIRLNRTFTSGDVPAWWNYQWVNPDK